MIITRFDGMKVFRALMDGNANFVEIYTDATGYWGSAVTGIDINDDGHTDFLFSGQNMSTVALENHVLQNNGDGTLTLVSAPSAIPAAIGGYYKSGYLDDSGRKHLVAVADNFGYVIENEGNGVFTQIFTLNDPGSYLHVAIEDINHDGLNDISVISNEGSGSSGTMLYKNLGNLDFQAYDSSYTGLPNVNNGEIEYVDANNDGRLDAVIAATQLDSNDEVITKILFQSDYFTFTGGEYFFMVANSDHPDFPDLPLRITQGAVAIYDYNNDGKPDILFMGNHGGGPGPLATPRTYLMTNMSDLSVDKFTQAGFIMYPNPARDIVSFTGGGTITSIEVYNQLGQKVRSARQTNSINVESLSAGIYHVVLLTESGLTGNEKLIKKQDYRNRGLGTRYKRAPARG